MKSPARRYGLVIAVLVVLAGFAYLIKSGIGSNLVYFVTPAELVAKGADAYGQPFRLGGVVSPQSVTWDAHALDLRFKLRDEQGGEVIVHASKVPPPMFREGIGAVVEGKYSRENVFEATNVLVKHSNEYKAPPPGHNPRETYKSLIQEPGN